MGKVIAVLGGQWGDEGKGKIVDFLTKKADVVARATGGNNAGHTVVVGDETFKFHLLPSGIVQKGKLNIVGNGTVIDPKVIVKEIETMESRGYEMSSKELIISSSAHVILQKHIEEDMVTGKKIGTTNRGIGPCYADKIKRTGLRIYDYVKENNSYAKKLRPLVRDTYAVINKAISQGKNVLIEGAQGALLDIDHGTYPFVTSSNPTAGGICTGLGIGPTKITGVHAVMKAYITRVGGGVFMTELGSESELAKEDGYDQLKNIMGDDGIKQLKKRIILKANDGDSYNQGRLLRLNGMEYGTTTGRPRRTGWFDAVAAKYSVTINGLSSIFLTKLDVFTGLKKLKICKAYQMGGEIINDLPVNIEQLKKCKPIYEEMPGWEEDLSRIKTYDGLPKAAVNYTKRIEELIGVPISILSVGPERTQTFVLKDMFF